MLNATCSKFSMNLLHLYKGCTLIVQNIPIWSLFFCIVLRIYACFHVFFLICAFFSPPYCKQFFFLGGRICFLQVIISLDVSVLSNVQVKSNFCAATTMKTGNLCMKPSVCVPKRIFLGFSVKGDMNLGVSFYSLIEKVSQQLLRFSTDDRISDRFLWSFFLEPGVIPVFWEFYFIFFLFPKNAKSQTKAAGEAETREQN